MDDELVILLGGRRVGTVWQAHSGAFRMRYESDWREDPAAYPLSISLPLARAEHEDPAVGAFLEGLLPDNEAILQAWGRRFQVSHRNPFALLRHVGEDCAGAVQFVAPQEVDTLTSDAGGVKWLTEAEVEGRLHRLREDRAAWRAEDDVGSFSLAGSQAKTAYLYDEARERWGIPRGRTPTTHILKPPMPGLEGVVENEHACLQLARAADIPAAFSEVRHFGEEVALVVERYDRQPHADGIQRIHQEDICQAFGLPPRQKYENQGGPGAVAIVRLLSEQSSAPLEDIWTFVRALAMNWVIAGSDAHAKNYSLLHGPGSELRLAPLYDVISVVPCPEYYLPRLKLAMHVGGEYRVGSIQRRHWERLAVSSGLSPQLTLEVVGEVCEAVTRAMGEICARSRQEGVAHPTLDRLEEGVLRQADRCRGALES